VNSTYELKDLISRLARLICQIFNAQYCLISLLDPTKKYSVLKCLISDRKKYIIDKKLKVSSRIEKRILKRLTSIRQGDLLAIPLISEDIIGLIIIKRKKQPVPFDAFDQELA